MLVVVCQGWIVGGVFGVGPSVGVGCWRWWKLQRTWLMGRRQKRVLVEWKAVVTAASVRNVG